MSELLKLGPTSPLPSASKPKRPTVVLSRTQKVLVAVVATGAIAIAGIGFAGSYTAVQELAEEKHFGGFAAVFPIGIDIGIGVFLALDLLLTWLRMPFPLLRQGAWLLTAATICFNSAAAWPDPLGVGMHAVIPLLFVIAVEAARHAVGRVADITADKHIESPPVSRWLLAPVGTFSLWRRQRLWQLRSYETVVSIEREAVKFRLRLRKRYGRLWRWRCTDRELLALRFARYGTPVAQTLAEMETEQAADEPETRPVAPATAKPEGATAPPPQSATPPATKALPAAPRKAATKAPPKTGGKRHKGTDRGAAKDAIRALYTKHGRRPLEGEMTDELERIKSPHTSRQFANKIRAEIEHDEPNLAALGTENVRPFGKTGS